MGKKNFRHIQVPDIEQEGSEGWGSNVLPLGNRKILSSSHLKETNKNMRKAGFDVIELEFPALRLSYGFIHCLTAYLK